MTLTSKQWTLLSGASVALLVAVAAFGGRYRVLCALLLPLCLWLSLRHEPEQKQVRPAIQALGWTFACVAIMAVIGSAITILADRWLNGTVES